MGATYILLFKNVRMWIRNVYSYDWFL